MTKSFTILKPEVKQMLLDNKMLRISLFEVFGITQTRTLKTWVDENNPKLTTLDCLKVISAYTGIGTENLTTEVAKMSAL